MPDLCVLSGGSGGPGSGDVSDVLSGTMIRHDIWCASWNVVADVLSDVLSGVLIRRGGYDVLNLVGSWDDGSDVSSGTMDMVC